MSRMERIEELNESDQNLQIKDKKYDKKSSDAIKVDHANRIIVEISKDTLKRKLFIPAYLMIKIDNFNDMQMDKLSAAILTTIKVCIGLRQLKAFIIEKFGRQEYLNIEDIIATSIILEFSRNDTLKLSKDNEDTEFDKDEKAQLLTLSIQKQLQYNIIPKNYFLSPFVLIQMRVTMCLKGIIKQKDGVNYQIRFNCMNTNNQFVKMSYNPDKTQYGQFSIARGITRVEYSDKKMTEDQKNILRDKIRVQYQFLNNSEQLEKYNKRVQQSILKNPDPQEAKPLKQEQQKTKKSKQKKQPSKEQIFDDWNYAHFFIPMYRTPWVDVLTIFVPFWLLGLINLLIFFQPPGLADRLANIATIMVAIAALVPSIREQSTPSPEISLVEIMILLEIGASLFGIIQSFLVRIVSGDGPLQAALTPIPNITVNNTAGTPTFPNAEYLYLNNALLALFWISVAINIISFLVIMGLFVYFCYKKYGVYDKISYPEDEEYEDDKTQWFQKQQFVNQLDKYYQAMAAKTKRTGVSIDYLNDRLKKQLEKQIKAENL